LTSVGYDAHSGTIVSRGNVKVLDRAVIGGDITSAGDLDVSSQASVSGTQAEFVTLPPMSGLPALPAFPTPNLMDATVNSGTLTIAPGSRVNGTVNGGTLVFQAGTYYFRNLTINSNTTVRAPAGTTIYVRDSLAFRSSIKQPTGNTVQSVTLGFAGATTSMEAVFNGTFIAPNASVQFGVGSGLTFTGAFYGRSLEVRPASTLVCQTSSAVPPS
jgi:cytoskeletal protein CcmA (bactofilin family)